MSIKTKIYIGLIVAGVSLMLWDKFFGNMPVTEVSKDFKEVTFYINDQEVTFTDGVFVHPVDPGSAFTSTVSYFGNELVHDLDGDGDMDVVFLVTEDRGGSGTFFYVVGAIKDGLSYRGTQAMFLGDRIAPQSININEADHTQVVVNYTDRAPDEPMSASPSIGKSMYVLYNSVTNDFGEVVQDFEGESVQPTPDKNDLIVVTIPNNGATVTSPIKVSGQARGTWFFEASFPIIVTDWDGLIIGEGYATADGEWMTEDFVPFTGEISYDLATDTPYKRGLLIFKKDNPSGLSENDDALEIPVLFE